MAINKPGTTSFKLYHASSALDHVELTESAWIETSNNFVNKPTDFSPRHLFGIGYHEYSLPRFYTQLLQSPTAIRVSFTREQREETPFQVPECSDIALALSILSDGWFVAGIECKTPSGKTYEGELGTWTTAPWTSFLWGARDKKVEINGGDVDRLRAIFRFIYERLHEPTYDENKAKLIFLYAGAIVAGSSDSNQVLGTGFPDFFRSNTLKIVLNSALFMEHVFTRESEGIERGVNLWNSHFPQSVVDYDTVGHVYEFRHVCVHDNASRSNKKLQLWMQQMGYSDTEIIRAIEDIAVATVKNVMRAIATDFDQYQRFKSVLP